MRSTFLPGAAAIVLLAFELAPSPGGEKPRIDNFGDPLPTGAIARLGTVRLRHSGSSAIVFSADSSKLTSFGADGVLRTWEKATGRLLAAKPISFYMHGDVAVFSPNGKLLAFQDSSDIDALFLWDVEQHKLLRKISLGERWWSNPAAFSPDSRVLITTTRAGTIHQWSMETQAETPRELGAHKESVRYLSFTPDGKLLTIRSDQTVRLWDLAASRELWSFTKPESFPSYTPASFADMSPDGKVVAVLTDSGGQLHFWEAGTGKVVEGWKGPTDGPFGPPRFSSAGNTFFVHTKQGLVLWDPIAGKALRTLPYGPSWNLIVSPDQKTVAGTARGTPGGHTVFSGIWLWDLVAGRLHQANSEESGHQTTIVSAAFSKDGRYVATAGFREVRLWDAATARSVRQIPVPRAPQPGALAFSADRHLFVGTEAGIEQFDLSSGEKRRFFAKGQVAGLRAMGLSADGRRLSAAVGGKNEYSLQTWDLPSGKLLHTRRVALDHSPGGFSSDNSRYFTADGRIISVETGRELNRTDPRLREPFAVSPNGAWLALGHWESHADVRVPQNMMRVDVLETATLRPIASLQTRVPGHLAFTPDGSCLIAAGNDVLEMWDLASERRVFERSVPLKQLGTIPSHFPMSFDVSRDGRRLVTGHPDSTALIWDIPAPARSGPASLSDAELEQSWIDLGGDSRRAFLAHLRLRADADNCVKLLKKHVTPAKAPSKEEIKELVTGLGSPVFRIREAAAKRLEQLGPEADALLKAMALAQPSLELEQRLGKHFASHSKVPTGEDLRQVRAIKLLEEIHRDDARLLIETLATGTAEAWRTRAARETLNRLQR